jgi:hypothetical protein
MSPTQGQAYIIGATFAPAIYFPSLARTVAVGSRCLKARRYGWLPMSDAYRHLLCKRSYLDASGILFMLANPIFNLSSLIFHLNASGIILLATPIFNLSSLIFHLDASGIILLANPIFNLSSLIFHLDASGIHDIAGKNFCFILHTS